MNDLVSDSLARISNAVSRRKPKVNLLHSNLVEGVCRVLKDTGFVADFSVESVSEHHKQVIVELTNRDHPLSIKKLTRVSTPGRRVYRSYRELKPVLDGMGIAIISTPKGVLSDIEARKQKVGGELICEIY